MNDLSPLRFDHSRHKLAVRDLDAPLDVLAFEGKESLSQPFIYHIELTSPDKDLAADPLLGKEASLSFFARPANAKRMPWDVVEIKPLRTLKGVITGLKRLSDSVDLARYEVTLEPRLALLARGQQYRIYQYQSVPQIVESILRSRHDFRGQDFFFNLLREYPSREQVMQYDESDLAFISRLLAEVGIWYRITHDERLKIDVVEFHDGQRYYQYDVELEHVPQSGLSSSGQDAVWALQTSHQVVEKHVNLRTYQHRLAREYLDTELDLTRGATTTYGEAYHYADAYTELGNRYAYFEDIKCESGQFYARLHHERYLNEQTRLSGISSSATLAPGQVLKISGGAPQAFAPGTVITHMTTRAGRDRGLEVSFQGTPFSEFLCFRPPLLPKPQIPGTVPARVTSSKKHDPYGHIDIEGRYKVNFLFDRDTWDQGKESLWLRLARPYAGDTHGLHLPLLDGTEVAVAFEQGDPDRPYIAHALHDSQHPDHVTLRNYKRNVLRTPTNNKLRMDDTRGQEHVKLSTEHSGKSQLNLGHVVDSERKKRGQGAELRTDGHAAIRAGSGLLISADEQAKAQGPMLEMAEAMDRLKQAGEQVQGLSTDAQAAKADPADVQAQLDFMREQLDQLKAKVALVSAPQGIALTSGEHLQLAARSNLMLNAGAHADLSVVKRLFIGVGQGLSLFVRKLGIKLIANQGPVKVQAQNDTLELMARLGLEIVSSEDEIRIVAKKKITLNAAGSYITLDECGIESGTGGDYKIRSAHFDYSGPATMGAAHPDYPQSLFKQAIHFTVPQTPNASHASWAGMPYTLLADGGELARGVLAKSGQVQIDHQVVTRRYQMVMNNGVTFDIPVPTDYRNTEQAHLANRGLHNHPSPNAAALHTDHRALYAAVLEGSTALKGKTS